MVVHGLKAEGYHIPKKEAELSFMRFYKMMMCFLIVFGMTFLTGCWNYNETTDMALATGMAIDEGSNGNYKVTVEIVVPQAEAQGSNVTPETFSVEGRND